MATLTIKSDLINRTISIVYGFEVDYSDNIKDKDYNNNGTWGKIVNQGKVIKSVTYNPNIHHNFISDYTIMMSHMKRELSVYQSLQPKQIEQIING